jgi:hypothetical protein
VFTVDAKDTQAMTARGLNKRAKVFDSYLDAWKYCIKHRINVARIKRAGFYDWRIE